MEKGSILIVDDNKSILSTLEILLSPVYQCVTTLSNPNQIPAALQKKDFDLVLLDMNFNAGINTGNEGLYWLSRVKEMKPEVSVVMITAYGDIDLAVKALKAGATDFVLKPWDNQKLLATLHSAIQLSHSKSEVSNLKQRQKVLKSQLNSEQKTIVGSSPAVLRMMEMVGKVAKTDANVLITGENGTGKELIAAEIHRLSNRADEVLVNVDMGAITETLFESELFGHMKGAFTDAAETRAGKFEAAHKGSLFLDEIGNLSYHLQAKLLAAIQNRQVIRIGSNTPIPVDIRLICATNRNLDEMVTLGSFREDLLYRINTIHIEVPPLRDRGEDILELTDFFLEKYSRKYGRSGLTIHNSAAEKLLNYSWPGNVRELQHSIEKAVILSDSSVLKPENFFMKSISLSRTRDAEVTLDEMEQRMISQAIGKNHGNMSAAADQLGITRQTLYNKVKKYGL